MEQKFNSEINWDGKMKFCKVYLKDGQKGKFFMGDLNKLIKVIVQKNTGSWAKEGEWQISLVPVKYTKVEEDVKQEGNLGSQESFNDGF